MPLLAQPPSIKGSRSGPQPPVLSPFPIHGCPTHGLGTSLPLQAEPVRAGDAGVPCSLPRLVRTWHALPFSKGSANRCAPHAPRCTPAHMCPRARLPPAGQPPPVLPNPDLHGSCSSALFLRSRRRCFCSRCGCSLWHTPSRALYVNNNTRLSPYQAEMPLDWVFFMSLVIISMSYTQATSKHTFAL